MSYLLDTNILSELSKPCPHAGLLGSLEEHRSVCCISAVTWHELVYGVVRLPGSRRKTELQQFLKSIKPMPLLAYDRDVAAEHARLRAAAERAGKPQSFADGQVAATALFHRLTLVTRNRKHFAVYPDLAVEDWFS